MNYAIGRVATSLCSYHSTFKPPAQIAGRIFYHRWRYFLSLEHLKWAKKVRITEQLKEHHVALLATDMRIMNSNHDDSSVVMN
jgi:hypothetical protein